MSQAVANGTSRRWEYVYFPAVVAISTLGFSSSALWTAVATLGYFAVAAHKAEEEKPSVEMATTAGT